MGSFEELIVQLEKVLVELSLDRLGVRHQDLLGVFEDAKEVLEKRIVSTHLRQLKELTDHLVYSLKVFGIPCLQDPIVLVDEFHPVLVLLIGWLLLALTTLIGDLALLLTQGVESRLRVHLAKLVGKDPVSDSLLERLRLYLLGLLHKMQQLGHPEYPNPCGHLRYVSVDELP